MNLLPSSGNKKYCSCSQKGGREMVAKQCPGIEKWKKTHQSMKWPICLVTLPTCPFFDMYHQYPNLCPYLRQNLECNYSLSSMPSAHFLDLQLECSLHLPLTYDAAPPSFLWASVLPGYPLLFLVWLTVWQIHKVFEQIKNIHCLEHLWFWILFFPHGKWFICFGLPYRIRHTHPHTHTCLNLFVMAIITPIHTASQCTWMFFPEAEMISFQKEC